MRFFVLYDFQNVVLLSFLGSIILVLLYMAFGKLGATGRSPKAEKTSEEHSREIRSAKKPIPLILIFVYAGFLIWTVVYVLFVGIRGNPF